MPHLTAIGRAIGAAGAIASIITIFQSGEEAYAVLQALQCNSSHTSDLLTSDSFETFLAMSLPIALFLYLFVTHAERKSDENTPPVVNALFTLCKTLSLHIPIIMIIMLTVIVTQSVCTEVANQDVESIRVMGWSYVILGLSFTLSSIFGANKNEDDESDPSVFNFMYVVEHAFHAVVLMMIGAQLKSDNIYTSPDTTCQAHYDEFNYQFLPSNNPNTWIIMAFVFGGFSFVQLGVHLVDVFSPRAFGARLAIFKDMRIACVRRVLAIVSRLFVCLFVAGLVMECAMTGCRPFADETSSTFKVLVILSTVSFIPTLLTQQLEWDADTAGVVQLFNWMKTEASQSYGNIPGFG
jgi:hypothetical protein